MLFRWCITYTTWWQHFVDCSLCLWSRTDWTIRWTMIEFLSSTRNTETVRNQTCQTRTQTQDKEVRWKCSWKCGGGSVCQRRLHKRIGCQQDSPHTLLLCKRWKRKKRKKWRRRRRRWRLMFFYCCDRQSNNPWSRSDTRTDHSIQRDSHIHSLSC